MKADLEKNVPVAYLASFDSSFSFYISERISSVFFSMQSILFLPISRIPMPFSLKSILIEDTCTYFQVTSKLGLTLKWNWADTLLV